jgi:hypothetical protein
MVAVEPRAAFVADLWSAGSLLRACLLDTPGHCIQSLAGATDGEDLRRGKGYGESKTEDESRGRGRRRHEKREQEGELVPVTP